MDRYTKFLDRMQKAAAGADSGVWGRYTAAQHIDCWSRIRVRRYGPSFGGPYRGGMPGDWGRGRCGPPCYDSCPKLHASTDTIESWKVELEKLALGTGDFTSSMVWHEARDFQFAKPSYFCSEQCNAVDCNKPLLLHKRRDPILAPIVECPTQ